MLRSQAFLSAICFAIAVAAPADAACVNLQEPNSVSFEGTLIRRTFAGPPNYEDVRKGDAPERTYILKLDERICAAGDEFVDAGSKFDLIQLFPNGAGAAGQGLAKELRRLVGQRVSVEGKSAFGAHTGHHHAPIVMPMTRIAVAPARRSHR
jgi:Domain of unknown function (DUF4431)